MLKKEILWLLFWSLFIHNIFIYQLKSILVPRATRLNLKPTSFPYHVTKKRRALGTQPRPQGPQGSLLSLSLTKRIAASGNEIETMSAGEHAH